MFKCIKKYYTLYIRGGRFLYLKEEEFIKYIKDNFYYSVLQKDKIGLRNKKDLIQNIHVSIDGIRR